MLQLCTTPQRKTLEQVASCFVCLFVFTLFLACLRYNITCLDIHKLFGEFAWDYTLQTGWDQTYLFVCAINKSSQLPCLNKKGSWTLLCSTVATDLTKCFPGVAMQSVPYAELRWPVWISDNLVVPEVARRNLWCSVYLHALPPTDVCTLLWQIIAWLYCLVPHLFPLPSFPPVTQVGHLWQLFEPEPSAVPCKAPHSPCHTSLKGDALLVNLSVSRLLM